MQTDHQQNGSDGIPAPPRPGRLAWLTVTHVRVGVGCVAAVVALLLFTNGLDYRLTVAPKPPKPKPREAKAKKFSQELDRSPDAWRGNLELDAQEFGIQSPTAAEMNGVFEYREHRKEVVLEPGDDSRSTMEAAGLRLRVSLQQVRRSRRKQLVLEIENQTDHALAYRVETGMRPNVTQACHQKDALPHNAVAIASGDLQMRSECVYRKGWKLAVTRVETMVLPEISFRYVSMLFPPELGIERRVAAGHKHPGGEQCRVILPAEVKRAMQTGETSWRDLIDFFARHRCKTYSFPVGYKAFENPGEHELPAAGARP